MFIKLFNTEYANCIQEVMDPLALLRYDNAVAQNGAP